MKSAARRGAGEVAFGNPDVAEVFDAYPPKLRAKLMRLRRLILDVARTTEGVGALEETLKWGQPSYLTPSSKSGSTIRIDRANAGSAAPAMFFICHTNLVDTFRQIYPDALRYDGNRGIVFDPDEAIDEEVLRHCISLALTYHLRKRLRRAEPGDNPERLAG